MEKAKAKDSCRGDYGVNMVCYYKGILFVLSGVGTLGSNHTEFIDQVLTANADAPWKICVFHKNQEKYQIGDKPDETGYSVYDTCRKHGAMIITGHEHSYARTRMMSNFAQQEVSEQMHQHDYNNVMLMTPGRSFAVVSGISGYGMRHWNESHIHDPWWASLGALDNDFDFGALLCEFFVNNNSHEARCDFKDIRGRVLDSFKLISAPLNPAELAFHLADESEQDTHIPHYEYQIISGKDLMEDDGHGGFSLNPSSIVLASKPSLLRFRQQKFLDLLPQQREKTSRYSLRFRVDNLSFDDEVYHAYLQLFAMSEGSGTSVILIRGYSVHLPTPNHQTTKSVEWRLYQDEKDDVWKRGEVVVSPDLRDIIQEILAHSLNLHLNVIELQLEVHASSGDYVAHGFGDNPCLAPTLMVEINP